MRVAFDPTLAPQRAAAARGASAERAREVLARRTPLSTAEIREAVGSAYGRVLGRPAPEGALRVLTAHVSLETARGQRMFNYNFGGIKGASPEGATARYQTHEVFAGKRVKLEQPFRAYASAEGGAADYLNLLRKRYPDAVAAAERGDARAFAERLGRAGYFTAPSGEYAAALEKLLGYEGGPPPVAPVRDERAVAAARAADFARAGGLLAPDALGAGDAARRAIDPLAAGAGLPLDGAELSMVLDALAVAGAARIAAPAEEEESAS